jgi:aminoglycoside 6'-N-acetyltransferase I
MTSTKWRIEAPKSATDQDWLQQRLALWPDSTRETHSADAEALLAKGRSVHVRLAYAEEGRLAGFSEAALRTDYVNGCETSPVAFLEGIYVEPWARRQGVAKMLVAEVEAWAVSLGCREFASDALLENRDSHRMHQALGFEETERVVYFRKLLATGGA